MRKTFLDKSTMKGIFAGFLVCCLFGIVTFANWTDVPKFFTSWGSANHNNKLSAETWDAVLKELDTLKAELQTQLADPALNIPTGAVVAFAGRSTCPDGWGVYGPANGRVIMGTYENSTDARKPLGNPTVTGANSVQLRENNIPKIQLKIRMGEHKKRGDNANTRPEVFDWDTGKDARGGTPDQRKNNLKTSSFGKDNPDAISVVQPSIILLYCYKK